MLGRVESAGLLFGASEVSRKILFGPVNMKSQTVLPAIWMVRMGPYNLPGRG